MAVPQIPERLVVELSRPTILNIAALICYCLAMMFHIIAFTTDNWSILKLDDVEWRMGLWYGCRHNMTDDTWHCSKDVFNDKVFKTGSNWHTGSQIMMTFALVLLFLLEFAVIGYACIRRLERHKDRVVGVVIALSVTAGGLSVVAMILVDETLKTVGTRIGWSLGMEVLSFIFLIATTGIITFDRCRNRKSGKRMRKSIDLSLIHTTSESSFTNTSTVADVNIDPADY